MAAQKKKATARANARNRAQRQLGMSAAPRTRQSVRDISQSRFPGETPLTGEDRPSSRRRGKKYD
jgi:hypothetical protein